MQADFWKERWAENRIGFHSSEFNPSLVEHFDKLALPEGSRIFVPLCGKTLDIAWLLSQGYRVTGAELAETAVQQLFEELGLIPEVQDRGEFKLCQAEALDIYIGDIFGLRAEELGRTDAIYDRAALVALPKEMRTRYSEHLTKLTNQAPQLLITFEYDQSQMQGPPFSISHAELKRLYGTTYKIESIESAPFPGRLKERTEATKDIWHLSAIS